MAVPNIFGSATTAIPLSQLDTNFATAITLGNTAVYLGNTTTSLGNVTLTNVTISSGNVSVTGANVSGTANVSTLIVTGNATIDGTTTTIQGLTVGRGAGAVSTNTAVGASALAANQAGGTNNTAIGNAALDANTTGDANTAVGDDALGANTTASNNTAVGYQAGYNITTGSKNTILGGFNGNQGGLDIRTSSNNIVLSDGDGNVAARWANGGGWFQLNNSASWSTTSDARVKENVATISNGLDVVMALRPVEFDYKISQQHTAGFIAQEYEAVLPDQIIEDANISDELKALTDGEPVKGIQQNLVPYLVSAIQALKAEFDTYKATHP